MSKYTFYNKIISDDELIIGIVSHIHRAFNYKGTVESIKNIKTRFEEVYGLKFNVQYVDWNGMDVPSWCNAVLKRTTKNVYTVVLPSVFDEEDEGKKNDLYNLVRFMYLKAIGYVILDNEPEVSISLSFKHTAEKMDVLAEKFALEFLIPTWTVQKIKKQKNGNIVWTDLTEGKKEISKDIAVLRLEE